MALTQYRIPQLYKYPNISHTVSSQRYLSNTSQLIYKVSQGISHNDTRVTSSHTNHQPNQASKMGLSNTLSDSPIETAITYLTANPIPSLIALITTYLLITSTTSYLRLRHIPGPFFAKFTYIYFFRAMIQSKMLDLLPQLQSQYGPLSRIGPKDLLLGDIDELLRTNSVRSGMGRSDWFATMRFDWTGNGMVSMLDTAEHDTRKALLMIGYEGKGKASLEGQVDSQLVKLVALIREKYVGKVVDWAQVSRWFSLDVATLAVMGKSWGDMDSQSDLHGFFSVADDLIPYMHSITTWAGLRRITSKEWFLKLAGPKRTDKDGIGYFMGVAKTEIAHRFANPNPNKNDMLNEWIKKGLTQLDCDQEVPMATIAGSDTAASPLRSIMLYIASTPHIYAKLKAEIAQGIKQGRISSPITTQEAQRLPYLQAVLHESLRMAPTTSTGFAKRVNPGGETICGYDVPAGTDIWPNMVALMQNREAFGEDVDVFRPERWLECTADERICMDKHVDMLFGHGRFQCPGRTLVWIEMNKVFVELLRNFDVQIARPQRPWTLRVYSTLVISDFHVRFVEGGTQG